MNGSPPFPLLPGAPAAVAARSFGAQLTPVRRRCQSTLLPAALLALALAPVRAQSEPAEPYPQQVLRARAVKDSLFRHGEDSPLIREDRPSFAGLRYFPVDPSWRVEGEFHRYGRLRQIRIPDTGGTSMLVERYGRFVFQRDGKPFWLEVYRSTQGGDLTVYFTDLTSGVQSYGAGRYAAVQTAEDGTYVLDFNGSYSPYCAYNPDYICPLPPPHNRLPFAVTAGELAAGPDVAH